MGINLKKIYEQRLKEYELKLNATKHTVKRNKIIQEINYYKEILCIK